MTNEIFEYNGEQYTSMAALAKVLDIPRLRREHLKKYGITLVDPNMVYDSHEAEDSEVEVTDSNPETTVEETPINPSDYEAGYQVQTPRGNFTVVSLTMDQMVAEGYGYHHTSDDNTHLILGNGTLAYAILNPDYKAPETVVTPDYETIGVQEFSDMLRKMKFDDLEALSIKYGVNTYDHLKETNQIGIRKMRMQMGLKAKLYPDEKALVPGPSKSEFSGFSVEELIEAAKRLSVPYNMNTQKQVQRMLLSKAFKAAGFTAKDISGKA